MWVYRKNLGYFKFEIVFVITLGFVGIFGWVWLGDYYGGRRRVS